MAPKRSRNGAVNAPTRVVAPTTVKGGSERRSALALGPLPIITSSAKSSIAEYRRSSTARASRCISSMKSTSPDWSDESVAHNILPAETDVLFMHCPHYIRVAHSGRGPLVESSLRTQLSFPFCESISGKTVENTEPKRLATPYYVVYLIVKEV